MSTKVYTPEGLFFDFTSEPALEALKLMKKIMALSVAERARTGHDRRRRERHARRSRLRRAAGRPTSSSTSTRRCAWPPAGPTRKLLHLGRCRSSPTARARPCSGRPAACLFKYGQNKDKAAEYMKALTYNERIWKDSIGGTPTAIPASCRPTSRSTTSGTQQAGLVAGLGAAGPRPARQWPRRSPTRCSACTQFVIGQPVGRSTSRARRPIPRRPCRPRGTRSKPRRRRAPDLSSVRPRPLDRSHRERGAATWPRRAFLATPGRQLGVPGADADFLHRLAGLPHLPRAVDELHRLPLPAQRTSRTGSASRTMPTRCTDPLVLTGLRAGGHVHRAVPARA